MSNLNKLCNRCKEAERTKGTLCYKCYQEWLCNKDMYIDSLVDSEKEVDEFIDEEGEPLDVVELLRRGGIDENFR